jgi:hypothetical protein
MRFWKRVKALTVAHDTADIIRPDDPLAGPPRRTEVDAIIADMTNELRDAGLSLSVRCSITSRARRSTRRTCARACPA